MTCAEFQQVLPYIIGSGGNLEEAEHLRSCPVCADLVADLRYIAEQAKLLVPMEDPHPRVWNGIQKSLQRSSLAKPGAMILPATGWTLGMRTSLMAALVVIAIILLARHSSEVVTEPAKGPLTAANGDQDDQQLLAELAAREPSLRGVYEDNLRDVNAYIAEAGARAARYPDDEVAREHLTQAYNEKAVLYEMADLQLQ